MTTEKKVFVGFGVAVAILLGLVVVAQRSLAGFERTSRLVAHTQEVLTELETLHFLVKESESSHRGYAVTGDTAFVTALQTAFDRVPARLQRIRTLTSDNPVQHWRLDTLSRLVTANLRFRTGTIAVQKAAGIEAARRRIATRIGKLQGDSISMLIEALEAEERSLLRGRSAQVGSSGRRTIGAITIGTVLALATIGLATLMVGRAARERQNAERAVRESEVRLGLALEAARLGAWDLDLVTDTAVRSPRHDQIFGYESMLPEWGSKVFMTHILPDDLAQVEERFALAMSGGTLDFECRIVRPDGAVRWIAAEGRVYRNALGEPIRMLGTVADTTDRKTAEQAITSYTTQLEAANAELEAFSYSVSHDLRAPLRHIDGFADLLRRHAGPILDDKSRSHLLTISEAAKQMGRLIDDLLVFSRMGRSEMHMTTVELGPLVTGAIRDLQHEIGGRAIQWTVGSLPAVSGDPSMLKQVVTNLISNAVKYTSRRGAAHIEIGVGAMPGNDVTVFVRDNGAGFDPRYSHKLFGVFQRLHSSAEFEGTGIGLAIVRRIVTRHGGRAWAEGAPDAGATFFVSLPRPQAGLAHG